MDTSRVSIVYRPLRIAWAIKAGDIEAFRRIARLSCTLAGGRYNPIVIVDTPESNRLIECFRADVVRPVGDAPELKAFADTFPHLIDPWFGSDELHYADGMGRGGCHVLDIHNILAHWQHRPEWRGLVEAGIRRFVWQDDDPLADAFVAEHGAFPATAEVHADYASLLTNAAYPEVVIDVPIDPACAIPAEVAMHPSYAVMGRFGVSRYPLSDRNRRDQPGFYLGRADDLEDLVAFWNLRATDVPLHFIDRRYLKRFATILPIQQERMKRRIEGLDDFHRVVAVWSRGDPAEDRAEEAQRIAGDARPLICTMTPEIWNGFSIRPPTMMLGQASTLGVIVDKHKREAATFALADKPFSGDSWFHGQKLVASVSMFRTRLDHDTTFQLPYIPELNERFGRLSLVGYAELRVEPNRIGIVVSASSEDVTVYAVPTLDVVEEVFKAVGLKAGLSNAGLITRQLITQMGGVDSTRVFKIPGVRRLIRTQGLKKSVKRRDAIKLIGERDPENRPANFKDHARLFIEPRPFNIDLQPDEVFSHLVSKRVFRIGADIDCPTCRLTSWIPLDDVKQSVDCTYCGAKIDTTRHFSAEPLTFRRSGLLGIEKNMQGAIPVTMVLQQLMNNVFHGGLSGGAIYMPSMNVEALEGSWPQSRETDFFLVELTPGVGTTGDEKRTRVVIGEAKDRGLGIDQNDADTMRRIASAFPRERFEVFVLFAKLNAFAEGEIAVAGALSQEHNVILLTDQELEPYNFFDRAAEEWKHRGHSLDELVQFTRTQYPTLRPRPPNLQLAANAAEAKVKTAKSPPETAAPTLKKRAAAKPAKPESKPR